ncbi:hypothetical protein LCGC14_0713530 [marine sediment metagenome]|uniref:Uncharacterized protein n=1 Tax=marine sediment metagenome TaxID=412755 RepID=A0A0F9QZT8_9ZZZZ
METPLETRHTYHCMFCGSELVLRTNAALSCLECPSCPHMEFTVDYCPCNLKDCTALVLTTTDNWYDEDWATLTPVTDATGYVA